MFQYVFVGLLFGRRAVVSYWRKYVHEVLVNRVGGLSLPRKSVVRLTDRPDMTLDVYRGRKTTMQQQQQLFGRSYDTEGLGSIQPVLGISNTDISKYPLTPKNIVHTHFLFMFTFQLLLFQALDNSK